MSIQVTEDEVDKRMRQLRDLKKQGASEADISILANADPNKRYRFSNAHSRRVKHFQRQGYKITPPAKKGSKDTKAVFGHDSADGVQELNDDLVLMETSRENYVDRVAKGRLKNEERAQQGVDQARDRINKMYRDEAKGKPHLDIVSVDGE